MALIYLGSNNTPNYTCIASDIDGDNKVAGASKIGNTILSTDDGAWYIIGGDLALINYALPISAGPITIDTVAQGNASATQRWLVNSTPPNTTIVLGALNGSASQTVTDITGATVAANKVFQGNAHISLAVQNPAATITGSAIATITWVPGTGGTTARRVATVNLELAATGVSLNGISDNNVISVPLTLYAGTTGGKFQGTVTIAGTITSVLWDFVISGTAQ